MQKSGGYHRPFAVRHDVDVCTDRQQFELASEAAVNCPGDESDRGHGQSPSLPQGPMPCDGETVMAAGQHPNPRGEAQRRTRARSFFAAKRPRGAGLPAGKKGAGEGFGCGTAAIGRSAISRESCPSDEGARHFRWAPFTRTNGAPEPIITLGKRLGFASKSETRDRSAA